MNYRFAIEWLRAFRSGPEATLALYADDFLFEDEILDAAFTDKAVFARMMAPYSNTDPTNGIGIHNFQIKGYVGDKTCGLILWTWEAIHCSAFLGLPTNGKTISTDGHSWQVYDDNGKIKRESAWWDPVPILQQLEYPVTRDIGLQSNWPFSLSGSHDAIAQEQAA